MSEFYHEPKKIKDTGKDSQGNCGSSSAPTPAAEPLRDTDLLHDAQLFRCLPYLKSVRQLAAPKRRLFGLLPPSPAQAQVKDVPIQGLDAAALSRLLDKFFTGTLKQLELDFELPGQDIYIKRLNKTISQSSRFTVELFQEGGRFLCVCFDDGELYLYWLIADRNAYYHEDSEAHPQTTMAGRTVAKYLVHVDPALIRQELPLLLANLDQRESVSSCLTRMGVWSNEWHYRNKKKHQELRDTWCFPGN